MKQTAKLILILALMAGCSRSVMPPLPEAPAEEYSANWGTEWDELTCWFHVDPAPSGAIKIQGRKRDKFDILAVVKTYEMTLSSNGHKDYQGYHDVSMPMGGSPVLRPGSVGSFEDLPGQCLNEHLRQLPEPIAAYIRSRLELSQTLAD